MWSDKGFVFASLGEKIKADRLHLRDYPHTPIDYRHTDKHLKLVMALIALCCESANKRMDKRTDRQYQVHYLPRFVVNNNSFNIVCLCVFVCRHFSGRTVTDSQTRTHTDSGDI